MLKFLLTNDDGLLSHGMQHLEAELSPHAEVWAVAPDRERSATSQAISLRETLRLTEVKARHFMVNGYPVDCVNVALYSGQFPPFDLVISGINHGFNLGDDIHYSGTVGAARHAAVHGYRAIAISCPIQDHQGDFRRVARWFREWLFSTFSNLRPGLVYNINYPAEELTEPDHPFPSVDFVRHGHRVYVDNYDAIEEGKGYSIFRLKETVMGYREESDSDFTVTQRGKISISPISIQTTDGEELKRWNR